MNAAAFFLGFNDNFKRIVFVFVDRFKAEYDIAVHLNKSAVRIVSKSFVAGFGDDTLNSDIIKSEVEDGIHHTRH